MSLVFIVSKTRPKRILLVDDDGGVVQAMEDGLRRKGYQVKAYLDPTTALAEFKPGTYDMAVLDVRMSGMDGLELHRHLMGLDTHLSVFFLSAYSDSIKGKPNGVRFLQKPISLAELTRVLESS